MKYTKEFLEENEKAKDNKILTVFKEYRGQPTPDKAKVIYEYALPIFFIVGRTYQLWSCDIRDFCQGMFVLLFEKFSIIPLDKFHTENDLRFYLFRMASNKARDIYRREKKSLTFSLQESDFECREEVDNFCTAERCEVIKAAVAFLPEPHQTLIKAYYNDGLSYREITINLRYQNEAAVRQAMKRARDLLRERLLREHPELF